MKKLIFILTILCLLIMVNCQKKNTNEPPANNIHPQVDIPWPSLADSPWPAPHGDMQCTGRSKFIGPREGVVAWTFTDERYANENSGVVLGSDNTIYFTAQKHPYTLYLYAMNPDGSIKWKNELEGQFASTPIIGVGDVIYVLTYYGPIYAFNADGSLRWKFGTSIYSSFTYSPAIGLDGTIYFADADGRFYAINVDGTLKWTNEEKVNPNETLPYSYSLAMSPDGAILYGAALDSTLNAFDAQTGTILWDYPTGSILWTSPMVDAAGNIYFLQHDSTAYNLCSLNAEAELRWENDQKLHYWTSFHIDKDGNIYVCSVDKRILSLDYEGKLRWSSSQLGSFWPSSIIGDNEGVIYFAHSDRYILALDKEGNQVFECVLPDLSGGLFFGALSSDGHLYLSGKYQFFCIK